MRFNRDGDIAGADKHRLPLRMFPPVLFAVAQEAMPGSAEYVDAPIREGIAGPKIVGLVRLVVDPDRQLNRRAAYKIRRRRRNPKGNTIL